MPRPHISSTRAEEYQADIRKLLKARTRLCREMANAFGVPVSIDTNFKVFVRLNNMDVPLENLQLNLQELIYEDPAEVPKRRATRRTVAYPSDRDA